MNFYGEWRAWRYPTRRPQTTNDQRQPLLHPRSRSIPWPTTQMSLGKKIYRSCSWQCANCERASWLPRGWTTSQSRRTSSASGSRSWRSTWNPTIPPYSISSKTCIPFSRSRTRRFRNWEDIWSWIWRAGRTTYRRLTWYGASTVYTTPRWMLSYELSRTTTISYFGG